MCDNEFAKLYENVRNHKHVVQTMKLMNMYDIVGTDLKL